MVAQNPNPIPVYISGDASFGMRYSGTSSISSTQTDADGNDASLIYSMSEPYFHGLLRKVKIYSRGTNGAGRALLWIDDGNLGYRECIGEISWDSTTRGLVKLSGAVQYFNLEDEDPDPERMRGYVLRQDTRVYIQIEDSSISDGYRVHCEVRNLTQKEDLNDID